MINRKNIIIVALLMLTFIYGVALGRYNIFPYSQLVDLRDWYRGVEPEEEQQPGDIEVYDTALIRLLIKKIEIEEDHSPDLEANGGAIASINQYLYLYSNRNDEYKERLGCF